MKKRSQSMSNSKLIDGTLLSPNHSGRRKNKITKIAIHHTAGIIGGWNLAKIFVPRSRQASANYNLGSDGVLILGVDEANRAWTTSSSWCDNRAVTIEVGNSTGGPQWLVSDRIIEKLIQLCVDICERNGIYPCTYTGDSRGTLQMHRWYGYTTCPGPYLAGKFSYIANEVTRRLKAKKTGKKVDPVPKVNVTSGNLYKVTANALNVRSQPTTDSRVNTVIHRNEIYTITTTQGSWGKLKSGAGWVHMSYMQAVDKKPYKTPAQTIRVGDKVKILGGKYSTGGYIPGWVLKQNHIVSQISGRKALLGANGGINSWVPIDNIRRV